MPKYTRQIRPRHSPELTTEDLIHLLLHEEARHLARAIAYTWRQVHGGFMAHATAKSHVDSLWGTADYLGVRAAVKQLLGDQS